MAAKHLCYDDEDDEVIFHLNLAVPSLSELQLISLESSLKNSHDLQWNHSELRVGSSDDALRMLKHVYIHSDCSPSNFSIGNEKNNSFKPPVTNGSEQVMNETL